MIRRPGTGTEAADRLLRSQVVTLNGTEYRRVSVGFCRFEMQRMSVLTCTWVPASDFPTLDSVTAIDGWMVSRSPEYLQDLWILGNSANKHVGWEGLAEWSVRVGILKLLVAEEIGREHSFYGQILPCAISPMETAIVTGGHGDIDYAARWVEREAKRIMVETVEASGGIAVW